MSMGVVVYFRSLVLANGGLLDRSRCARIVVSMLVVCGSKGFPFGAVVGEIWGGVADGVCVLVRGKRRGGSDDARQKRARRQGGLCFGYVMCSAYGVG